MTVARMWNAVEVGRVKRLMRAGVTVAAIAAQLDRSEAQVQGVLQRLRQADPASVRLRKVNWTRAEDAVLSEMIAAGADDAAIAARLKRPKSGVTMRITRLRRHGAVVPFRQPRWTDDEDLRVLADEAAGRPLSATAAALGRSPDGVGQRRAVLRLDADMVQDEPGQGVAA